MSLNINKKDFDVVLSVLDKAQEKVNESLEVKQIREMVPIEKWVDNEYYIGKDGARLYDFWKEELIDIFKDGQRYNEVILECALGTGKTTVATYMLIRKLYEMSCFHNIAAMYGLMSTASTFIMYLSPTLHQGELTGFGQLKNTLDSIPYFQREFVRDEKISSILKYPERIILTCGSNAGHQIGTNLIATILDESNFFSQGRVSSPDALSTVAHLHNTVVTRSKTRFMRNGVNNSLSILISSPTYKSSYTQDRILKAVGDPTTKVVHGTLWTIKGRGLYSPKTFPVFKGSDKLDPFLIHDASDINAILSSQGEESIDQSKPLEEVISALPPHISSLIDNVPIDFKKQYEDALVQSLQDISGISVNPTGRLFSSRAVLARAIDPSLPNWFTKPELVIQTGDNSEANTISYYLNPDLKIDYEHPMSMHIDQSVTTDSTGIAGAHKGGSVERDGQLLPTVVVDFALRVNPPPPPKQISITRIRSFTLYLYKVLRIPAGVVSYDQYQCFVRGTKILTTRGMVGVELLRVGDTVINKTGLHRVRAINVYYDAPTRQLITNKGKNLLCTPNHVLPVRKVGSKQWTEIKAKDIEPGDQLEVAYHTTEGSISIHSSNPRNVAYLIGELLGGSPYFEAMINAHLLRIPLKELKEQKLLPFEEGRSVPVNLLDLNVIELTDVINGLIDVSDTRMKNGRLTLLTEDITIRDFLKYVCEYRIGIEVTTSYVNGTYEVHMTGNLSSLISKFGRKIKAGLISNHKVSLDRVRYNLPYNKSTVYGITVADDPHLWANGIYSHNSTESRQVLQENGINTVLQSVDRDDTQYLNFVNMLQDGRVRFSQQVHDLISKEIFDLIHYRDKRRVDHPEYSSKDVMDAVVGAVWNALNDPLAKQTEQSRKDARLYAEVNSTPQEESEEAFSIDHILYGYRPQ